ncbi:hypothetical protein [Variovorax paradoxus]|uniref:hypothetical protein n=1 Tax=Variovorax paradoxus TaxID=34073 RepID=UPI0030CD76AD
MADTYPNPSNATFRTAIGALWDYVTGLLGATGNAAEARVALGIGPVISFRNLLINGNFAINQRAYVSGANTTGANQYTLDRWRIPTSGQNATFGAASPDRTVTFPASGGEQVIEGANIVGGVYTLSWTGAATATVNGAAITNGGNTASLPANTNVTVKFVGAVGQAQFELGTVPTPFERRPVSFEELLCRRYFQLVYTGVRFFATGAGQGASAQVNLPVVMRATPTVATFTAGSAGNAATFSYVAATIRGFRLELSSSSAGDSFAFDFLTSASAEL